VRHNHTVVIRHRHGRRANLGTRRVENAQVAVYLTYAAPRGHALIDRETLPSAVLD
jgi:hypothetical protein